jgi:hypothetical protein
MRCLTYAECRTWCLVHGYPVTDADFYGRPRPAFRDQFEEIQLAACVDRESVGRARHVVEWAFRDNGELLLWVSDWAVWPSHQHMPLFTRFREGCGEKRPLIEAPGHLITPSGIDDGISVLATALWLMWDCSVFPANSGPVYFCSHDEWNSFFLPPGYNSGPLLQAFGAILNGGEPEVFH